MQVRGGKRDVGEILKTGSRRRLRGERRCKALLDVVVLVVIRDDSWVSGVEPIGWSFLLGRARSRMCL